VSISKTPPFSISFLRSSLHSFHKSSVLCVGPFRNEAFPSYGVKLFRIKSLTSIPSFHFPFLNSILTSFLYNYFDEMNLVIALYIFCVELRADMPLNREDL